MKRSWFAIYAPVLIPIAVIVVALFAAFSTPSLAPKVSEIAATPTPIPEREFMEKRTKETDARVQKAVRRVSGDWNKMTAEEQKWINEISMRHGKEMVEMTWLRLVQEDGKPKKP